MSCEMRFSLLLAAAREMRCGFCVYIIFSLLLSSNVAASNDKYVFAFYGSDSTLSFLCKFNVVREILSVKLNRPPSISHFCCCCWLSLSRQLARSSSACARDFPLSLPTTSELEMMDKKKVVKLQFNYAMKNYTYSADLLDPTMDLLFNIECENGTVGSALLVHLFESEQKNDENYHQKKTNNSSTWNSQYSQSIFLLV